MVLAGFALTSRCLPYGSDADAEPLLRSTLRAVTMGERAGDVVGDITQMREREKERVNLVGRARVYMVPSPCRSSGLKVIDSSAGHPILLFRSMQRVNSDRFFYVHVRIDRRYERGSSLPLPSERR